MKTISTLLLAALIAPALAADPTPSREWTSTAGTKLTASAIDVKDGKVSFKQENGKLLTVPLDKLIGEDRAFLAGHFGDVPAGDGGESGPAASSGTGKAPKDSGLALVKDGLAEKIGEVVGPIDAGEGSHYFLYIPTTLKQGRKTPLLHYNGSGGGSADSVKKHIAGAELNGWIVVASVESNNNLAVPVNHQHAVNTVKHVLGRLPVDEERVYFTGGSGGGAMSFYNAARIKSAGAMPHIGYIPQGTNPKPGHFFVINGATDYNRYTSASAVGSLGKDAVHRFHNGGHSEGPEWLCTEGMAWLNGRYLAKNKRDATRAAESLDYESSMIAWIAKLRETEPHRAYFWCQFLINEYKLSGANLAALQPINSALAAKPECAAYVKGIKAIGDFSERQFTTLGKGSLFQHTTPKIEKAAERLASEFAGVPMIEELAKALGKPTVGR